MTEDESEARSWAVEYARDHALAVVEIRDRRDRVVEEIAIAPGS
jgi:hypothetical protein